MTLSFRSSSRIAPMCSIARFARCDVRSVAAVFVGAAGTESVFRQLLLQIGGANIANPLTSSPLADLAPRLPPCPLLAQHGGRAI